MEFNQNRLRFVHCEHLFNDINEIKHYVRSVQNLRASLYAEPMIFKYGDEKKPCIVLAIGSVGNGKFEFDPEEGTVLNETFYIDFSQVERDVTELYKKVGENKAEIERIDGIVKNILISSGFNEKGEYIPDAKDLILKNAKSLKEADKLLSDYIIALEKRQELYVKETTTIKSTLEKGETGTTLSSDVKLGTKIFDGRVIDNIIIEQENGIFTNVDLEYVEDESKLVFTINGENKKDIKLPVEYHVVSGKYDTYTENIILKLNKKIDIDGNLTDSININVADLIDEWTVMGDASETPIVLTKEHIKSEELAHEGHHEWQDVLKADVRIVDKETMPDNILSKSSDGKKLFVEGKASNISYMDGNKKITVQEGIDGKIGKTSISQNPENTIVYRTDGLYSMIDFDYDSKANKIIFKRTNPKGEVVVVEKELNSLQLIKNAYYDNVTEEIVIVYVDAKGEVQELRIPMQIVVDAFDVDNTDTTVTLTLKDVKPGVNTLKADVNISKQDKNILEDVGHALYVRGTADNIQMIDQTLGKTVEETFTKLNSKLETSVEAEKNRAEGVENGLRTDLTEEINRAKKAEEALNSKIETSSRDDKDERDRIERKLDSEIDRSTKEDSRLDGAINSEKERAEEIEQGLRTELDAEVIRSTEEDARLDDAINQESIKAREEERIIRDSVATEARERKLADADIQGQLTREIDRSTNKDKVFEEQLGLEITRATEKEKAIESSLNKEIQDRKDNDQAIKDIVNENSAHVDAVESNLKSLITAEETRAKAAEKANETAITAETETRKAEISRVETKLDDEIKRSNDEDIRLDGVIKEEVNRSTERDEKLASDLDQAKKDLSFIVKNTGTIDLTKVEQEFGSYISGKVNVSGKENNLINKDGEPLFASVDISYDGDNNKLILSRSGAIDKEIQLNSGSLIESIVYDSERKVLIITYYDSLGNEKHEEVYVGDLFNQWVVETNHLGAVQLTKDINYDGKGRDKLTAEVVVSKLPTNNLVNDKGSLYVSNEAKDYFLEDGTSIVENISSIKKQISDEIDRSTKEDIRLNNEITAETQSRKDADTVLDSKITTETKERKDADAVLDGKITDLKNDVDSAKTDLSFSVEDTHTIDLTKVKDENSGSWILSGNVLVSTQDDNLINNNGQALYASVDVRYNDTTNTLTLVKSKGNGADSGIIEKTISLNAGSIIQSIVYNDSSKKLEVKYTDAKGINHTKEVDLSKLYNNFIVYNDALSAVELTKTDNFDKNGNSKLSAIVKISDKGLLKNDNGVLFVSDSAENIVLADGVTVSQAISSLKEKDINLNNSINEEKSERESEITRIEGLISAETTNRIASDSVISTNVSNNSTNLKNEIDRALGAEEEIRQNLQDETNRANKADKDLLEKITKEVERAVGVESKLESAITTEKGRAELIEQNLSDRIDDVETDVETNKTNISNIVKDVEEIVKSYAMSVEDTTTVDLTKKSIDAGGFVVSADVKVSSNLGNTIIKQADGIFSNVDLTYDETNNTLHFKRNDKIVDFALNTVSTIKSITYDSEKDQIVIKYEGKNGDTLETRFPASSLFKPIKANNEGKNVTLEVKQIDGTDTISGNINFANCINNDGKNVTLSVTDDNKLSADVNVSSLPNNLIHKDEHGSLYASNQSKDILMCAPETYGSNVCDAIVKVDDKINKLEDKFENYYDEDLINSMNRDIVNLKSKTNMVDVDSSSIDLTFTCTENSSSLRADVIPSNDPHNLVNVYNDGLLHIPDSYGHYPEDTYNGVRFDGNIDYQLFTNEDGSIKSDKIIGNDKFSDWTRHLQIKRNDKVFDTRKDALAFLHRPDFLADKKDGEPLVARYKNDNEISFILGFVRISEKGEIQVQTIDNKGTIINKLEYIPNEKDIITTDEFGIKTITHVGPESLYLEFTDSSSIKHSIVTPLKELVEEYTYPQALATHKGEVAKADGVDDTKLSVYDETSARTYHNVIFDIERKYNDKSIIKADIDYYDCGEYDGEDFIKDIELDV